MSFATKNHESEKKSHFLTHALNTPPDLGLSKTSGGLFGMKVTVFGMHQYIEGCRKSKQKLMLHFIQQYIKKGRKYQCIILRNVGNYPITDKNEPTPPHSAIFRHFN